MTHMLHRSGTRESLNQDYCFLMMPSRDINLKGSAEKMRRFLEICLKYNPASIGDGKRGNRFQLGGVEEVLNGLRDGTGAMAVYDNEEVVAPLIKELKEADLGLSVTIEGLFDKVEEKCKQANVRPHAELYSLGIWGKTDQLPSEKVLDVVTMCGHGMVSAHLVQSLADDIKSGRITFEKAGLELARQCVCGVFNPTRASNLLKELVK